MSRKAAEQFRPQSRTTAACFGAIKATLDGKPISLVIPALAALCLVVLPFVFPDPYWLREISLIAILAMVVSGVNLSFGFAGELQLGQVFMFAAGGYVSMALAVRGLNEVVVLMLIGGLAAVFVGLLVAIPALRIGGWSLAMASFFLVITIPDLTNIFSRFTGGLNGLYGIPDPELFGHPLDNVGLYEVTIIATVLWFACYRNLVTSRFGIVFKTLRESTTLTQSLGYSTFRLKTLVYALGAFPAGVAGCLFGYISFLLQPSMFDLNLGIGTVAASVLGGTVSVYGVFVGATLLQLGPELSTAFASYAPVGYGVFLIFAAVLLRGGVASIGARATGMVSNLIPIDRGQSAVILPDSGGAPTDSERIASLDVRAQQLREVLTVQGQNLCAEGVSMQFGGVVALRDVTLSAEAGQITALIGSNGSGKTTLLNAICGYISARGGIELGGRTISGSRPHHISRLGVARTFQTPIIPCDVTVRDVVASGRYGRDHIGFGSSIFRLPRYWRSQSLDRRDAMALLEMAGLAHLADAEAASQPLGTRRMVEVLRALCGRPGLVLLDEPASGLNDAEVIRLAELLRAVADGGATVIVIEHNFRFVSTISDVVHVLHLGQLIATGTAEEVASDPQVVQSYLGESSTPESGIREGVAEIGSAVRRTANASGEPLLAVDSLESGYRDLKVLAGVSLAISQGTIEAILGPNGAGKTTLVSTIAGLVPTMNGSILLEGRSVGALAPHRRASAGIVLVQEGKRIFRQQTVWQNVMLGTNSQRLGRAARQVLCREVIENFPALKERLDERAGRLSGGQQQMVAIAQALASHPKVLILDEPSAGLAPAIVDELFARLRVLADGGLTIVLVEQLVDKALKIADHVTVLEGGRVNVHGWVDEFKDVEKLATAYFG